MKERRRIAEAGRAQRWLRAAAAGCLCAALGAGVANAQSWQDMSPRQRYDAKRPSAARGIGDKRYGRARVARTAPVPTTVHAASLGIGWSEKCSARN